MEFGSNDERKKALDEHVAELINSEHEDLPEGFYTDVDEVALAASTQPIETVDTESNQSE